MLRWDPMERIAVADALEHAYFTGPYRSRRDGSAHATRRYSPLCASSSQEKEKVPTLKEILQQIPPGYAVRYSYSRVESHIAGESNDQTKYHRRLRFCYAAFILPSASRFAVIVQGSNDARRVVHWITTTWALRSSTQATSPST